jgi:hypothetical protein
LSQYARNTENSQRLNPSERSAEISVSTLEICPSQSVRRERVGCNEQHAVDEGGSGLWNARGVVNLRHALSVYGGLFIGRYVRTAARAIDCSTLKNITNSDCLQLSKIDPHVTLIV